MRPVKPEKKKTVDKINCIRPPMEKRNMKMNKLKWTLPLAVLATTAAVLLTTGCGNQTTPPPGTPPAEKPAVTATNVLYTCPMHPDFVTNQPGSCPICGMHLVPKT
jgi:hypothetical protein